MKFYNVLDTWFAHLSPPWICKLPEHVVRLLLSLHLQLLAYCLGVKEMLHEVVKVYAAQNKWFEVWVISSLLLD